AASGPRWSSGSVSARRAAFGPPRRRRRRRFRSRSATPWSGRSPTTRTSPPAPRPFTAPTSPPRPPATSPPSPSTKATPSRGGPWYNPTRGDLLAVVDQRPYKAALDNKAALLNSARANLAAARAAEQVVIDNFRVVKSLGVAQTQEEYDQKKGALDQARANVQVAAANIRSAEADLETALLNLRYTQVRAPFTGRGGR